MGDLTQHFSKKEFVCKCGCGFFNTSQKLMIKLEKLRLLIGKPIIINSACRCAKHNAEVGGVADSQHTKGTAADIRVVGVSPLVLSKLADKVGFDGIGLYKTFVHVDVRGKRARWQG